MDLLTFRRYEMLLRVRQFGNDQTSAFPDNSLGNQLFATLGQLVNDLETLGVKQVSGLGAARSSTATKAETRKTLLDSMFAINRTARALAVESPGLENKFPAPRALSDQALLTAARAFAQNAVAHQEQFLRHELAADFLDELREQTNAFEQSITEKQAAVGTHRQAKVGLDNKIALGLQLVRQLDAVIQNKFKGNVVVLSNWTRASRITRRTRTPEPEAPTTEQAAVKQLTK